ncbi:GspE/PulE family protein [Puniceicoccus vermicola]|uniref:Type II/IV secretion system protein n=1 Tax=Puniceicoccus vermicola TaxID=388746 RepID=A0A7X1B219_9BACT|nr:GspE/PulE family protein [Puniceicoccus vermicola]MBC2603103.1 type II/IV secretion system protein [Puniceicoccus vermicola]
MSGSEPEVVSEGVVSEEGLLKALGIESDEEWFGCDRLGKIRYLSERLGISENETSRRVAAVANLPFVEDFVVDEDALVAVPSKLLHSLQFLPVKQDEDSEEGFSLETMVVWPLSPLEKRWIRTLSGRWPTVKMSTLDKVSERITERYGVGSASLEGQQSLTSLEDEEEVEDEDAAVIRFVNEVIRQALESRATDIHFEPHREKLAIRYRIDGELTKVAVPENLQSFQAAIISRIKIMAHLNISERRRPQDGRIGFHFGKDEIDIRISTFPTLYGESVSLRLLNQKSQAMSVDDLGLREFEKNIVGEVLRRPNGIILVTGPTGSGKSTSLNAFIRMIHSPSKRIMTVEDPVEYEVPGVNQTQIREDLGLTFARSLRHILRQDPDIIMVGEIRDRDTAEIAIRASLTGHLVLSTLHTNDAPGALTRLIDMEIEPFLIASSVELVIAQRLVRRLCSHCSEKRPVPSERALAMRRMLDLSLEGFDAENLELTYPVGCEWCRGLGYRGRVGVFEMLQVQRAAHDLVLERASSKKIREAAVGDGMKTLQQSAWDLMLSGISSPEEALRHVRTMEEDS